MARPAEHDEVGRREQQRLVARRVRVDGVVDDEVASAADYSTRGAGWMRFDPRSSERTPMKLLSPLFDVVLPVLFVEIFRPAALSEAFGRTEARDRTSPRRGMMWYEKFLSAHFAGQFDVFSIDRRKVFVNGFVSRISSQFPRSVAATVAESLAGTLDRLSAVFARVHGDLLLGGNYITESLEGV